jgi:glutathione synthase/RimK-type ligase-like ATP-grasp enzyme
MEIGILLNPQHKHESIDLYQQFAVEAGVTLQFLTFRALTHRLKLPAVIHNRTYARTDEERRKLQHINQNAYVFNGGNRYAKSQVHTWLMKNPYLRPNLPATERATVDAIQKAMARSTSFVLKPDYGATGRGIVMVWQRRGEWVWQRGERLVSYEKAKRQIHTYVRKSRLVLQQQLPLAHAFGHVYDLRVSVQRGEAGTWQVTGMVGKHAASGRRTTNLAQGGKAFPANAVLTPAAQEVVAQFALAVALQLSLDVPRLADIGLDIGVNENGFPMLIECNFRDLRYSFLAAGMADVWKMTYRNPILYARSIARNLIPAV